MLELDAIDRSLLRVLQKDNRLTNVQLARRSKLSPPACLRRVRRLRQLGVIMADVCLVDSAKVGIGLFVFVEVTLERQSEELQQAFERRMEKVDEVMQCYMIAGHTDYMLMVQVADMDAYHRFVRRVLTRGPNVRNFRSTLAMHRSKFQTDVSALFDAGR
jgi:Lrp/AsnC family transcriptional regulator, leucine-responsive regulatory protein